jgi:hypothetical protein
MKAEYIVCIMYFNLLFDCFFYRKKTSMINCRQNTFLMNPSKLKVRKSQKQLSLATLNSGKIVMISALAYKMERMKTIKALY